MDEDSKKQFRVKDCEFTIRGGKTTLEIIFSGKVSSVDIKYKTEKKLEVKVSPEDNMKFPSGFSANFVLPTRLPVKDKSVNGSMVSIVFDVETNLSVNIPTETEISVVDTDDTTIKWEFNAE